MERSVEVATGESVAFRYELAGLGSRFYAYFIDLVVQLLVAIAAFFVLVWIGSSAPSAAPALGKIGSAVLAALGIFAAFILFFGYFIAFEWRWGGRTPGKALLGIRVVRDGGFPLDFTSAVVRNVVRIVEMVLAFYALSAIVMLLSPQNRRLGDMAAGTLVVRDVRYEREPTAVALGQVRPDDPVLRAVGPAERDLIRSYAARRAALRPEARTQLAHVIAARVRPQLAASYPHLDDDALLTYLAEHALG